MVLKNLTAALGSLAAWYGLGTAPLSRSHFAGRPTGTALRDPAAPAQAARIEAAAVKRDRRAEVAARNASCATHCNAAHKQPFAHSLNPFYVAK